MVPCFRGTSSSWVVFHPAAPLLPAKSFKTPLPAGQGQPAASPGKSESCGKLPGLPPPASAGCALFVALGDPGTLNGEQRWHTHRRSGDQPKREGRGTGLAGEGVWVFQRGLALCALSVGVRVGFPGGLAVLPPAENFISHGQRCAAITSDMCEMLLGDELPYRGCLSTVAAFILERGESGARRFGRGGSRLVAPPRTKGAELWKPWGVEVGEDNKMPATCGHSRAPGI